ncbi:MAG: hypothetical protein KAR40_11170 [Candidatus Sabulitectum sp.]|nr:hypothetical protein [Candidatus Sabulitectum sp.]
MSEFLEISSALDAHLNGMASLPPVAWENKDYPPVNDTLYLRPFIMPGDTVGSAIGAAGNDEHVGIYQIDVLAAIGEGKKAAIVMADLIADRFKPVTQLTSGTTTVKCVTASRAPAYRDKGRYVIPVTVRYLSLTAKR